MSKGVALLVIDFQNDIVDRFGAKVIEPAKRLIDWARSSGIPVIYTRVAYRPDYLDASPLHKPIVKELDILKFGERGGEIADQVAPQAGEFVLVRHRVSAFYNSELEMVLRTFGAHTVILSGFSTSRAIESTARDGSDRDLRMIAASDACAAAEQEFHDSALRSIADFFGEVLTVEEIIQEIGQA